MSYLLDTNICIHLFKGDEHLIQKIEAVGLDQCYLSEITILELMFGVENSGPGRQESNRENLNWLRAAFSGRILLIGRADPSEIRSVNRVSCYPSQVGARYSKHKRLCQLVWNQTGKLDGRMSAISCIFHSP
jgi:predicted nucleic acid-binding protein